LSAEGAKGKGIQFQIDHLKCPSCVNPGSPMPQFSALGEARLRQIAIFLEASKGGKYPPSELRLLHGGRWFDCAELVRVVHSVGAAVNVELVQDALNVRPDRLRADDQPLRDLPLRQAAREALQDLDLADRQRVRRALADRPECGRAGDRAAYARDEL